MATPFQRITIIGLGLIGGSWAMALKRKRRSARIVGCDRSATLKRALLTGAIDEGFASPAKAVRGSDLVILATPVGAIIKLLPQLKAHLSPNALVTDTGSTKQTICKAAQKVFDGSPLFIGGHPLAGKEHSGFRHADTELFKGAIYALAPLKANDERDPRVRNLTKLLRDFGAQVRVVTPADHDRALAFLSHLPQFLATTLAASVADRISKETLPLDFAASGFRDMTRLAESPYEMWKDVYQTNRSNIRDAIREMVNILEGMDKNFDDNALERDFKQAIRFRERLMRKMKRRARGGNKGGRDAASRS